MTTNDDQHLRQLRSTENKPLLDKAIDWLVKHLHIRQNEGAWGTLALELDLKDGYVEEVRKEDRMAERRPRKDK